MLRLLMRQDCHLCAEAELLLKQLGLDFATMDVDIDPEQSARWGDYIPVLLLDGEEILRAPISEGSLRQALGSRV